MDPEQGPKDASPNNTKKLNGIEFREGCRLEAKDHLGDKWWEAKVVEMDQEGNEVLVHFTGWNGRHDEWIKMDSPRLQPLHRRSRRLSTGPILDAEKSSVAVTSPGPAPAPGPGPSPSSSLTPGPSLYTVGEEVLALWKQNRKYPATILRIQDDGCYLVRFYDGFEKTVRGQCIRRVGKQDLDFVRQCKDQLFNGDKVGEEEEPESPINSQEEVTSDPSEPPKLRRERKSKFNVREILNLKESSPKKPATNSSSASVDIIEKVKNGDKKEDDDDNEDNADKIVNIIDLNESLDLKSDKSVSETGSEGTPSEKENISCEMFGKMSKNKSKESAGDRNGAEVKAKRERKRKRFADEEPELPAMKKSAKKVANSPTPAMKNGKKCPATATQVLTQAKSNKNSPEAALKKKSIKSKSLDGSFESKPNSKGGVNNSRTVRNNSSSTTSSSDKQYGYLSYDFSLPPEQQLENLIDGVTVPSHNKPVFIKSPKLPNGWIKKVVLRGVNHVKWEVLIENSSQDGNGKSFRSKADLQRYFEEQKLSLNIDNFDFSLDTSLKKIRQIWRSSLQQPEIAKTTPNGVKEDPDTDPNVDSRLPAEGLVRKSVKTPNSVKEKLKIDIPTTSHVLSPMSQPVSVSSSPPSSSSSSSSSSSRNSATSPCILKGNASETGQGVRCPIKTCNKLFRNDKLLLMHVKHYHPEHAVTHSPTVTDLAFIRTHKEEAPGGPVTEGAELASGNAVSQEDKFKVPDGKLVIKAEPAEPEKSKIVLEDKIETDGIVPNTTTKSETEIVPEVEESAMRERDSLPDTPKLPAGSRSRVKRPRADTESPPASPTTASPAPTLSSLLTVKMSKKRARSAPSTPPGELKDGTETMSEGEVVHCVCSHTEGDGMMVQCESCLTWQHGQCLGIDNPTQVPEKYVCSVCVSPPLGRQSSLYNIDMDWIREGKLSRLSAADKSAGVETELKTLSDLMLDLVNLSNVLHSLQVKLSVARQRSNPKVFMWSSLWEDAAASDEEIKEQEEQEPKQEEIFNNITSFEEMEIAKEEIKEEKEDKMVTENGQTDNSTSDSTNSGNENPVEAKETKEKPVNAASQIDNNDAEEKVEVTEETKNSATPSAPQENPSNFGSELAEYFSSEGFDFPSNLLPSVSEMQRLLPDVIKDISGSLAVSASQTFTPTILPQPTIIPEPKRLDRDECRLNLILHIENLQKHIQVRLESLDTELGVLEKKKEMEISCVVVASTMQDIRSAKIVNNSLPDRM